MSLAVVLPIGRTQFFGNDGLPLALGSVYYYIPETTNDKLTWEDPGKAVANTQPVSLDASGTARIFGDGDYRMVVFAANGSQLFDGYTEGLVANASGTGGFGPQTQIASANTTDLGTIASHNVLVTGAVTIGSFGNSASLQAPIYYVEVDVGMIITNSANILVPGAEDYHLDIGDAMFVEFQGAGVWKIIGILPRRGLSQGFGAALPLAAGANIDLGSLNTNHALVTGGANIATLGNSASLNRPIFLTTFRDGGNGLANGASLILPMGLGITTAAGDSALWEFNGAGVWTLLNYWRATALPLYNNTPLLVEQFYNAAGAFNFNVPAGVLLTTVFEFEIVGAGGAGGASAAGNTNGGQGGGAAGYWHGAIRGFVPGQVISVAVGTGGASAVDSDGNNGSASSIIYGGHTLVSAAGGQGGKRSSGGGAGAGGVVTEDMTGVTKVTAVSIAGGAGSLGGYVGSDINWSGEGGSSPVGSGGGTLIANSGTSTLLNGLPGAGFGSGGSGSVGGAGLSGGVGARGFVKIKFLTMANSI